MNFVSTYGEVKRDRRPLSKVRGYSRSLALNGLAILSRLEGMKEYLSKPRIQFLYIHHLFPDEEQNFRHLLDKLSESHLFISYSSAVEKILNRDIDKPYIVFSSDDGYKNNLKAGEILSQYDAKACFFINPSIINEDDYDRVKMFCKTRLNFPPVEFLGWDDVDKLQSLGHEIGSHTMNHINIAETDLRKVEEELKLSYQVLKERCGELCHFAYPYGRFSFFSERGRQAVFEAGYDSCASAERGCHINPDGALAKENLCIRRDHIILNWNINHIMYFIVRNAKNTNLNNNLFPYY